jgi:glutathione S-transferase
MSAPSVPPNSGKIMQAVRQALQGLDIGSKEAARILSWANSEAPAIYDRDQTAYLVLGSYRDPYLRRVRTVSDRLNRRYGTYAFLVGDLADIDLPRLPEFRVKFHITAALSDYVAAVFEQDGGGEINELGKLSETEYFEKAHARSRAYQW